MDLEHEKYNCLISASSRSHAAVASLHTRRVCPTRAGLLSRMRADMISATFNTDCSQHSVSYKTEGVTHRKVIRNVNMSCHLAHYAQSTDPKGTTVTSSFACTFTHTYLVIITSLFDLSKCLYTSVLC